MSKINGDKDNKHVPEVVEEVLLIATEVRETTQEFDEEAGDSGGFIWWVLRKFMEDRGEIPPSK